jgi:predicted RNase H-like nuclease (RuvC/YqgF family)
MRSNRGFSLSQIVEFVSRECSPLVIATDVIPAPKLIEKVAATFSVKVHKPSENFSKCTKSKMVRSFELSERKRHLKDALAAAVSAYESRLPMIRKIRKRICDEGLPDDVRGEIARRIFSGECNNIQSAIDTIKREIQDLTGDN